MCMHALRQLYINYYKASFMFHTLLFIVLWLSPNVLYIKTLRIMSWISRFIYIYSIRFFMPEVHELRVSGWGSPFLPSAHFYKVVSCFDTRADVYRVLCRYDGTGRRQRWVPSPWRSSRCHGLGRTTGSQQRLKASRGLAVPEPVSLPVCLSALCGSVQCE